MRKAVTFVVKANGKHELVFDPSVSVGEQLAWIKRTQREGLVCDYILHATSDGDWRRFHPPAPKPKNGAKKLAKA